MTKDGGEGRARERHLSSICWVTPQCPQRPKQEPGKGHHVLHWLPPGALARIQLGGMEHPRVRAARPVKDERDPNSSLTAVLHCWPSSFSFLVNFLEEFLQNWYYFFLKCLDFTSKAVLTYSFFCGKVFNYKFNFLNRFRVVQVIYFFFRKLRKLVSFKEFVYFI